MDPVEEREKLRSLDRKGLEAYAAEIRETLIDTVAANGGHLASNLGTVELTMALHRVFTTPEDKIIWDVGHQSYTHKIVTGRRDAMPTLRKAGGISGFPKEYESAHDAFDTGHSSTSISAALGMARARDVLGLKNQIVAVIGDGALSGGMVWEAMNDAGQHKDRLIVILNDNSMSIRPNVGAMSKYLARLRTQPRYGTFKRQTLKLIRPDGFLYRFAEAVRRILKAMLVPGLFFEEIGWTYLGPINGHNITEMEKVFRQAKEMAEPVIIHVMTRKGKGYGPAESAPEAFHSCGPFNRETGEPKSVSAPGCDAAAGETIRRLAGRNGAVCAITAAMTDGCGLNGFSEAFPDRFFDVGIAEEHAVTMAAGLASFGLVPYVCLYSTFLQRACDQVIHDVCLTGKKVVFCISHSGITGRDGATHQGVFTWSELLPVPGMRILVPSTCADLRAMLNAAAELEGPTAVCFGRTLPQGEPDHGSVLSWRRIAGDEHAACTILAAGAMVREAEKALELLGRGDIAIVDCRCVKPMDEDMLRSLMDCPRLLTAEDNLKIGGFGEHAAAWMTEHGYRGEIRCLAYGDGWIEQGSVEELRHEAGLDAEGIAAQLRSMLEV